jgi:hypothetical protein
MLDIMFYLSFSFSSRKFPVEFLKVPVAVVSARNLHSFVTDECLYSCDGIAAVRYYE